MRKTFTFLLTLLMVFSLATGAFAEAQPISVHLDDVELSFGSQGVVVENGISLAPARSFLEALELEFLWDQQSGELTIMNDGTTLTFKVDHPYVEMNGVTEALLAPVRSFEGETYVPIRYIGKAFGYEVEWVGSDKAVAIYSDLVTGPEPENEEPTRGLMWEVEHEGNTVYLVGSIHVGIESMYPINPAIEEAFASSDSLTLEIDLSKAADPETTQMMLEKSMYQDGTTLPDHISEEAYAELGEFLEEIGADPTDMDLFKPWYVATNIEMLQTFVAGYDTELGIDMHFVRHALEQDIPILELESLESQLAMFEDFSDELQEQLLRDTIRNFDASLTELDELANLWIEGNEDDLLAFIAEIEDNDEYNRGMLIDRNIPMTDQIAEYLQSGDGNTYFVVVGAGHMLGEYGIVTLLEEKGFTVVRR
ncbi:TraB/GumN family protein [Bacillus horti]|uniref:Uncharacterized protein YbaP (TraB family) n=1 Tax=Caldalkalibacillus horti TaxID=77523 RepID=A0ABT9VW84_9BACI|nr:TraB/GumN family protein [Bacillus horti]MDQ0165253.1 uncharacterized protein YbaP (TraB family) [Bacillus horti]